MEANSVIISVQQLNEPLFGVTTLFLTRIVAEMLHVSLLVCALINMGMS